MIFCTNLDKILKFLTLMNSLKDLMHICKVIIFISTGIQNYYNRIYNLSL